MQGFSARTWKGLEVLAIWNTCGHRLYPCLLQRRLDVFLQSRLRLKKRNYLGIMPWALRKLTQEVDLSYHCNDLKENLVVKMANKY